MADRKSIFITGAASGIGRETALLFANRGWFTGIVDVNETGAMALADRIGEDACCAKHCDVTDRASVGAAVDHFLERTGGTMHALFANAGIIRMGEHTAVPIDQQQLQVDVNVAGVLNTIDAGLPALKQTPGAHIVSMCSASAVYGTPHLAVYSASKFFVRGLTEALNIELERDGIQVSDIMVPYVQTPLVLEAEVQAPSVKNIGVKITPDKVAQRVWDAVHGNKVHWYVGRDMYILSFASWLFPFAKRAFTKLVTV